MSELRDLLRIFRQDERFLSEREWQRIAICAEEALKELDRLRADNQRLKELLRAWWYDYEREGTNHLKLENETCEILGVK